MQGREVDGMGGESCRVKVANDIYVTIEDQNCLCIRVV